MGFWHTGYMEFHEQTEESSAVPIVPETFPCVTCGADFVTIQDLRIHTFAGHSIQRPILIYRGRERGNDRLLVTSKTSASDWAIHAAELVTINALSMTIAEAIENLHSRDKGVIDVALKNGGVVREFQIEFAVAEGVELDGVDEALGHFLRGGELSHRAIDDFIMRSKQYSSAALYLSGLAGYLYGVLARENNSEGESHAISSNENIYQGKYDKSVAILGGFDRAPAEAICGLVAFHYNQFDRAMTKTRSQRVAEVSLRFMTLLSGRGGWLQDDLSKASHSSLDHMLSDSVMEQVLGWSALPLDGGRGREVSEMVAGLSRQRPYDAFKLHLIAAEHALAVGDNARANRHAEHLRDSHAAELWYSGFRGRVQNQGVL